MAIIIRKNTNLSTMFDAYIDRLVGQKFKDFESAQLAIEKELPWENVDCDTLSTGRGCALWYYRADMDAGERENDTAGHEVLFVVEEENSEIGYPTF